MQATSAALRVFLFDSVYVGPEKLRFLPQLSAVEPWLGEALALTPGACVSAHAGGGPEAAAAGSGA